ncbi:hypothetical protein HYH02_012066 [Chlamydomonas schloesseri]|uniref:RWD domain-containing protein 3 n=1 Tax=Chlamydomonas schloesseri TaxID=2026947 RepID=A0A835W0U2_9CHLO|nr:hypothetical protein HYH02_012066 [Chlamydomonas schloesseri]|eukprot:KAG2435070.1 hypothetical protein HYH02_012066 [Chlamydomonas schloesseri]
MADINRLAALLEVAALQAVYGAEDVVLQDADVQQLVDAASEGALEDEVAAAQLGSSSIDLTIRVTELTAGFTPAAPRQQLLQVSMRVRLPAAYPGDCGGTAGAAAASCSVGPAAVADAGGCGSGAVAAGGRAWSDSCTAALTELAAGAAQQGRACLHELVEAVQGALSDLRRRLWEQQPQQPTSGGGDALTGTWARDLGLTGRLVFGPSGLILELLEGEAAGLRHYLVRHRTEAVDVDSRGRKCKERMMDVIGQRPSTCRGADGSRRAFSDYREVQLSSLADVGQLLAAAGVADWLRPAAGLPPLPATR